MKTHYDWISRKQEETIYSRTICGKKDPNLKLKITLKYKEIDCKKCLNILNTCK